MKTPSLNNISITLIPTGRYKEGVFVYIQYLNFKHNRKLAEKHPVNKHTSNTLLVFLKHTVYFVIGNIKSQLQEAFVFMATNIYIQ